MYPICVIIILFRIKNEEEKKKRFGNFSEDCFGSETTRKKTALLRRKYLEIWPNVLKKIAAAFYLYVQKSLNDFFRSACLLVCLFVSAYAYMHVRE